MTISPKRTRPVTRDTAGGGAVDARALARDLAAEMEGEVRFSDGARALYATDASNYRQPPIGVVIPRHTQDIIAAMGVCRDHDAPVLPRGAGTSLAGQCCNAAVVIDTTRHCDQLLELDPDRRTARVQGGIVLDRLRDAARPHGLTFGPDPATHTHCTIGGMIGNDSCGVHSVMAGRTSDNIEALDVLLYDGTRMQIGSCDDAELDAIIRAGGRAGDIHRRLRDLRDRHADEIRRRFPDIPRRVSGYGLDRLLPEHGFHVARSLVGTEGTCAFVLEATVRLVPSPRHRRLVVLGYGDAPTAGADVTRVLEHRPLGLEGMDEELLRDLHAAELVPETGDPLLPDGGAWLLVEVGADDADHARTLAEDVVSDAGRESGVTAKAYDDEHETELVWKLRESGLAATSRLPDGQRTWPGWEDSAVPPEHLGDYLRDLHGLFERHGYRAAMYGHYGQGCVHCRIPFELTSADGIARYRRFIDEASDLVLGYGGSFSGEHGDGQARGELLPKMYGDELMGAFREFRSIWDPAGRMNPGKVIDAAPIDAHLRLGTDHRLEPVETEFAYVDDDRSFGNAAMRCVGVGLCRSDPGEATMCPSWHATGDEQHSTRGRARLLFEMLDGDVVTDGWRSEPVREALDLCLACKGCKSDCPVNVDMATYKSEFMSHYYDGRLRPRMAYTMGLIHHWARLAGSAPRIANAVSRGPLAPIARRAAGVHPDRELPAFAPITFRSWFRRWRSSHPPARDARHGRVLLWPDTFTNHLQPQVAIAAVEVLERAGWQVDIPPRVLCCGRPLYDWGMIDEARRLWRRTLRVLRDDIRAGTLLVGLEPSCVAAFRDELPNLFPDDEDAARLSAQTLLLSELLVQRTPGFEPPRLHRPAILQAHCHHTSVLGFDDERRLLGSMELDIAEPEPGCCGMAGAFGFEEHKYDVSQRIGERTLLPAVREAADRDVLIADGFSCREQIRQGTGRTPLHLSQLLQVGWREGPDGPPDGRPEDLYLA